MVDEEYEGPAIAPEEVPAKVDRRFRTDKPSRWSARNASIVPPPPQELARHHRWNGPRPGGPKKTSWVRPPKPEKRAPEEVPAPVRVTLIIRGLDDSSGPEVLPAVPERSGKE